MEEYNGSFQKWSFYTLLILVFRWKNDTDTINEIKKKSAVQWILIMSYLLEKQQIFHAPFVSIPVGYRQPHIYVNLHADWVAVGKRPTAQLLTCK